MTLPGGEKGQRPVIVRGVPFVGESMPGRELAGRCGWALHETDAINRERGLGEGRGRLARAEWTTTYRDAFRG